MKRYRLHNLDCAHCASDLEQALRRMEGVRSCSVNFGAGTLILDADDPSRVAARVPEIAAGVSVSESAEPLAEKLAHPASLNWLALVGLAAALVILACALWLQAPVPKAIAFGVAYALVGWRVVLRAGRNLVRGRPLDESFLMTVATGGAFAIGEAPEAVGVMLFYRVGELLQEMAVGRARRSIGALLAIRPDYANLREGEEIVQVSPDAVAPGQVVVVRPGERVPLDGRVLSGSSHIDASLLSGEPVPRAVGEGDEVFGGTINQGGLLEIEVLRSASESSAAKILDLVENAAARKAPTERFIARFATYYTPAVVGLTLLVAFVPPLFIPGATLAEWVHRGLVLLVISCPCAFMLSIPWATSAASAARRDRESWSRGELPRRPRRDGHRCVRQDGYPDARGLPGCRASTPRAAGPRRRSSLWPPMSRSTRLTPSPSRSSTPTAPGVARPTSVPCPTTASCRAAE